MKSTKEMQMIENMKNPSNSGVVPTSAALLQGQRRYPTLIHPEDIQPIVHKERINREKINREKINREKINREKINREKIDREKIDRERGGKLASNGNKEPKDNTRKKTVREGKEKSSDNSALPTNKVAPHKLVLGVLSSGVSLRSGKPLKVNRITKVTPDGEIDLFVRSKFEPENRTSEGNTDGNSGRVPVEEKGPRNGVRNKKITSGKEVPVPFEPRCFSRIPQSDPYILSRKENFRSDQPVSQNSIQPKCAVDSGTHPTSTKKVIDPLDATQEITISEDTTSQIVCVTSRKASFAKGLPSGPHIGFEQLTAKNESEESISVKSTLVQKLKNELQRCLHPATEFPGCSAFSESKKCQLMFDYWFLTHFEVRDNTLWDRFVSDNGEPTYESAMSFFYNLSEKGGTTNTMKCMDHYYEKGYTNETLADNLLDYDCRNAPKELEDNPANNKKLENLHAYRQKKKEELSQRKPVTQQYASQTPDYAQALTLDQISRSGVDEYHSLSDGYFEFDSSMWNNLSEAEQKEYLSGSHVLDQKYTQYYRPCKKWDPSTQTVLGTMPSTEYCINCAKVTPLTPSYTVVKATSKT